MKNASLALEQLHSGINIPEYSVTIPWLISEASLYRYVPQEHFRISPGGWPRLTFTCLGLTAEFGFNFVSLPGRELVELQLYVGDSPTLIATVNDWAAQLQTALGEPYRQFEKNNFRWFDDHIVVDCLVTAGKDSIDGEWHSYGSLKIVYSAGWPGHWNYRIRHESGENHGHVASNVDLPYVTPDRKRTYATSLTDDELILLDCLFNCNAPPGFLRREGFVEMWNFTPHNLNDDELRETIKRFVSSGMLETERDERGSYLCMTETGGREWEAERLPVWHRFASDGSALLESGKKRYTILAMTSQTRDEYWEIGRDIGYFPSTCVAVERTVLQNKRLIPWKPATEIYVLEAELDGEEVQGFEWKHWDIDWAKYEERRAWWRRGRENEKFWGESV
jgi:hypothetical protein